MIIKVVLVDDHPLFLEGVARLFGREADFTVVACCGHGEAALDAAHHLRPDLVIADLQMSPISGLELLRRLQSEKIDARVVLLTASIGEDDMVEAIRLGACGIVLKNMVPDLLIRCARTVMDGGQWLERGLMGRTIDRLLSQDAARQRVATLLTTREIELVRLVSDGRRNKEIANLLDITESTVKVHLHKIFDKLGVKTRVELANFARREGI